MKTQEVNDKKIIFVILIFIFLILISAYYAGINYRAEVGDGYQALYQIMNGHPSYSYINYRQLECFTHYIAYIVKFLISKKFSFKTIYSLVNFSLILNPFFLLVFTLCILVKKNIKVLIPFVLLNFALAVFPTFSFHVSLVPESILFSWLAFIVWFFPPKEFKNILYSLIGLISLVLYSTGYESIMIVSLIFIVDFIISISQNNFNQKKLFEKVFKIVFLILLLFLIYYRINRINTLGIFFNSLKILVSYEPSLLLFLLSSSVSIVVIQLFDYSKKNLVVVINFTIGMMLFFSSHPLDGVPEGFNLRVTAVFFSFFLMLLFLQFANSKNIRTNALYKSAFTIFIINFMFDIRATYHWSEERLIRKNEILSQHQIGCKSINSNRWTIGYEAVLFQETFQPNFLLFQEPDRSYFFPYPDRGNPCNLVSKMQMTIPLGFFNDFHSYTYSFSKVYK